MRRGCWAVTMFDRMIFKGHLLRLYHPGGVQAFLWNQGVALTGFARWATKTTEELCLHARRSAEEAGRPYVYLKYGTTRANGHTKEDLARAIAERDGISEGLVCILRAMEACQSFKLRRNAETHKLDFVSTERKCVFHYWYFMDPEFGFCHVRLQSWLPFSIQIYVNGREWLARQFDAKGVGYVRADNALLRIDELNVAGELCERFAHRAWPRFLDALARRVNIDLPAIAEAEFRSYYWCLDQAEVATDVMFCGPSLAYRGPARLDAPRQLEYVFGRCAALLGPQTPPLAQGRGDDRHQRPARRAGGSSATLARNSVKVYDKISVLRVETTINNPREFRILRVFTDERGRRERRWCPMGKGVANAWRYFQVGIGANLRYLDALAAAPLKGEGVAALDALCRSKTKHGRHHARFNPLTPADRQLFRAVLAGDHAISGFRNTDLVRRLYPRPPLDSQEAHRRCARVSRLIAKLHGHGLVAKVPRARLYRPTPYGYRVMTAAIAYHDDVFPNSYKTAA